MTVSEDRVEALPATGAAVAIDPATFRHVLGHYPSGVCVITAMEADGTRIGMTVGSFTSVSLDPPLVGFLPSASSTTWPRIERAGAFCVNILAHDQENICRAFARPADDKFAGLITHTSSAGMPVIDGAVGWIDCGLQGVHPAGDHLFVTGLVRSMQIEHAQSPLLFVKGRYGRFLEAEAMV